MARSTATYRPKTDRCHDCLMAAEVTVTNGTVTIRVCAVHADSYALRSQRLGLTLTPDPEANIAICEHCPRFIGHGGKAAHNCHKES